MVRRILIAVVVAGLLGVSNPASAITCTLTQIVSGACTTGGGTNGTDVTVWVDGSTSGGSSNEGGGTVDCNATAEGRCVGTSPPKTVDKPESVHDLETFRPVQPGQRSEPAGWTIVGLPTNFWSVARTHVVSGELAGQPADVRFIPVAYRRTFGDGASQSTTKKGGRWKTSWSATATSHVYSETGTMQVGLTVTYVAYYRFDGGAWTRLDGVVTRASPNLALRVFGADTVLVARTCSTGAIGCA